MDYSTIKNPMIDQDSKIRTRKQKSGRENQKNCQIWKCKLKMEIFLVHIPLQIVNTKPNPEIYPDFLCVPWLERPDFGFLIFAPILLFPDFRVLIIGFPNNQYTQHFC